MRQIWITHVHILSSETLKRQEVPEKKIAKEKGFKSEMYVLVFLHKLFKCLMPKPKTLCTFLFLLLSPNSLLYKPNLSLFPK